MSGTVVTAGEERAASQAQEYASSMEQWERQAEQGDPVSQFALGVMYEEGLGVVQHTKKAGVLFEKAARQGYVPAQAKLGDVYSIGKGVPKDYAMAAKWWERAAEQRDVQSQYNLAELYYNGRGVRKSLSEAGKWYRAAAAQGHREARIMAEKIALQRGDSSSRMTVAMEKKN